MKFRMDERVRFYNEAFPKYPSMWHDKDWALGVWSIGNNYKNKTSFYGAYPNSYLKRIGAMFPDAERVLHLFSGSLEPGPYTRFDVNPALAPDVVGNAENVGNCFKPDSFDVIFADPPYQKDDATRYGYKLPNKFKVVKECYKILEPGGYLVWMDERLPMYRKEQFKRVGEIMITRSTNHRVRAVFIFERQP